MDEGYTCSRCGAPLNVTPETIVSVCEYCGYPSIISGIVSPEDIYILSSLPRSSVEKAFWEVVESDFDLRRIRKDIVIHDIYGVYIPVWISKVHLRGRVSYYYYRHENKSRRRIYKVVSVSRRILVPLLARKQVTLLGAKEALNKIHEKILKKYSKKLVEVSRENWRKIKLEVLNTEYDKKIASERIREDALDILRERFKSKGTIDGFDVKVIGADDPKLYLIPLWQVYYRYKDAIYSMFFAGWDLGLLVKTEPVITLRRVLYLIGALAAIATAPALTLLIFKSEEVELGYFFLPLMAVGAAYTLSELIIRDMRVER
ncbi:MAG: hypothetical protein DRJ51_02140 [Thermoprotei archaeon]|nr:MAG: hypothetical protein DRJ51_02140 [Thermoprotei archaeon]RLF03130.1 MAG: hypothetical protein DRJ59_01620 [Thermoprotei archaeon]